MRANKGKNTTPELAVRRLLHALGYRFRLHCRDLPGTPDIVFPGRCKAIQVHGCFWHQHEGCRRATVPMTRRDYWLPKLARNRERDAEAERRLASLGWDTATVWECEVADSLRLIHRLQCFLGPPSAKPLLPGRRASPSR
ncbi:MAG: DNA mismatch endonuclease Vsr [Acetobacteraceae bacterium]|nr:DNA mismatch endonuclease Vsr [Acetobacteraceae bacterium]